ncbi:hypothetical protein Tco_0936121 [Tanacetum coccineum]
MLLVTNEDSQYIITLISGIDIVCKKADIDINKRYLTCERGIMVRALDAIISDASRRYDSLEISYLQDLRRYKIVILRMFLPEINLPSYVSNTEKAVEVASMTETMVAVDKAG